MKKITVLLLVLAVIFSNISFAEFKPFIRIITPTEIQELKSDESGVYKVKLRNVGNYGAQPLTATIAGEHPFRSDSSELTKDIRYVGVRTEHTLEFNVSPNPLAMDKIYEFDVIFSYADDNGTVHSNTEKAYIRIINENTEPILSIVEVRLNVNPANSETINALAVKLKNSGTLSANKVKATLSGMSGDGFLLHNDADTKVVGTIEPSGTAQVSYVFDTSEKLATGNHPLTLNLEFNDDYGRTLKKELQLFIPVQGKDGGNANQISDEIKITDIKFPETVHAEQDFKVNFKVSSTASKELKKIRIDYDHTEAFVAKKNSRVYMDLKPGETKEVEVSLRAKKEIAEGTVHTYILAAIDTGGSEKTVAKEYVGIFAKAKEDEKISAANRPKLIVAKYEYGGKAKAGEDFDLVLHIKNTSETQYTKNIKVTLTSSDGVFTPINSSSSLFVESIAPGATAQAVMRYNTKADAAVKIYNVGVKMEYEDGEGKAFDAKNNPFSETEELSLYVVQDAVLSVNDAFINPEIFVGDRFDIDIPFYNEGKAKISNLKVKIEGVAVRENSYYVGNFEPGQNDTFSVSVSAEEEGEVNGKFIFEFESPTGEIETIEKEFSYYVRPASERPSRNNMPQQNPEPSEEQPEQKPVDWLLIGGIAVAGLIVLFVVYRVVRKKRAQKQSLKALEEMFDE